jgi:ankyrin repeat protein
MDIWVNIDLDEIFGTSNQAAAYNGSKEKVETLLKAGADVNAQSGRSGTALEAAAYDGSKRTDVLSLPSFI